MCAESAALLRDEFKKLRQTDANRQSTTSSYRYTTRQLESLIRLSEAMARLHADSVVRPSYVREACRLLKSSNINIVKNDIEFAENQEDMNRELYAGRQEEMKMGNNDLFVSKFEANPFYISLNLLFI